MRVGKIIGLVVFLIVLVGGTIAGLIVTQRLTAPVVCDRCVIVMEDEEERQYTDAEELTILLRTKHLLPDGKSLNDLSLQQMEEQLRSHPMVRTAQCVLTPRGTMYIYITQRIPILQVRTETDKYFVDSDRSRMPVRESVTTPVMPIRGYVTETDACGVVADMVLWIEDNPYWQKRITSVYVSEGQNITLTQREGAKLLIGTPERYKNKLNKLQTFYQHFPTSDSIPYRALDARYAGQVVGVK